MPAEIYLNSRQRYDDLFVDHYNANLDALKKDPMPGNGVSQDDLEREAAMKAQRQAQQEALVFGLQDLFSTIATGRLSPD
jgi:hypothetical protein